ncbi:anthranilate phosphoribosyltransferase [Alteromonas sp. 5E99-2]|uniref:anthranilate phosphoribosyltransferase n=1 Tax=Alteromonas sp. 5E99-2 TaxID=2817683 RepID=UPI001F623233|nr:anthranilate phosphoribosyltransferase [Alteromonas sp. 5E99-2]
MNPSMDMPTALNLVLEGKSLSQADAFSVFNEVLHGKIDSIPLTALLVALKLKTESPDEIAGAARAMIANALPFPTPSYPFVDVVGTGGDGHNTINISSAAAILAAACGVKVAKHGNKSVSSKSGSADLFAACGVNLTMSPEIARKCLDNTGLCFLFAPVYHSGMKHVMPVRTQLKTRTVFNILGPLVNPANPSHSLLGVYSPHLLDVYAETLMLMGQHKAMIVHGDGLDELALHGESTIVELDHGDKRVLTVTSKDFGLPSYPISDIEGGEPEVNKMLIMDALNGEGKEAHKAAIAMNCSALLVLSGLAKSFSQGTELAMNVMKQGKAIDLLARTAELSNGGKC